MVAKLPSPCPQICGRRMSAFHPLQTLGGATEIDAVLGGLQSVLCSRGSACQQAFHLPTISRDCLSSGGGRTAQAFGLTRLLPSSSLWSSG